MNLEQQDPSKQEQKFKNTIKIQENPNKKTQEIRNPNQFERHERKKIRIWAFWRTRISDTTILAWTPKILFLEMYDKNLARGSDSTSFPCLMDGRFGFTPNLRLIRNNPFKQWVEDSKMGWTNSQILAKMNFENSKKKRISLFRFNF